LADEAGLHYVTISRIVRGDLHIPEKLKNYWRSKGITEGAILDWESEQARLIAKRKERDERRAA